MFLTHRISMGFGVSVVVHELSTVLASIGHNICICTLQADYEIPGVQIYVSDPDHNQIRDIAMSMNIDVIVAHTSPFFEVLPALMGQFSCWAWEHGDPSPDFFEQDAEERRRIIVNKQLNVYPHISGVIVSSRFLMYDIGWLASQVIHLACDHTGDLGKKTFMDINFSTETPLKIGTLMRLGEGEALYKGGTYFLELCEELKKNHINAEYFILGRGTRADAKMYKEKGFQIIRNASDEERSQYLRNLDVFISPSQWEGFNLPVTEAMKSGTLSMVFDVGAHPEVCPFLFSNIHEMVSLIARYAMDRKILLEHSVACYNFVNKKFEWEKTVLRFLELMNKHGMFLYTKAYIPPFVEKGIIVTANKRKSYIRKGLESIKKDGFAKTWIKTRNIIFR